MNQTLLVELFTEELPPKALAKLGEAFAAGIVAGLQSRDFLEAASVATSYASPRRLAVSITQVRATSPDKQMRDKVLPVSVALDANGNPTAPLAKKLAAMGFADVQLSQLERAQDGKAESFFYSYTSAGSALAPALQSALEESISKLPIPKVMSYQRPDGSTVHFVRPVHQLIALHGDSVVPLSLLGLHSDRLTGGHRFLSQGQVSIAHADDYASTLQQEGKVLAHVAQRKEQIRQALLAKAGADLVLMPDSLLDEVTALVEWPVVYECHFEQEFLAVPQECLILTMQTNQKYFALTDAQGKLRSRFLIVSNLETSDPQHIIQGNERVVRPRLADAKFFFEQDKKTSLESRISQLEKVVYHNKLGTQADRMKRVQRLAAQIASASGFDPIKASEAATIAKCDLLTDMVGEFPELQGIMGTYYARNDGKIDEVARAIEEHYLPRHAGDLLPSTGTGISLAIADKLETLTGIWSIGLAPTGDKDPFALRRQTLGILRILIEKKLPIPLKSMIEDGLSKIQEYNASRIEQGRKAEITIPPIDQIYNFMLDRLRGLLRDLGYSANEVEAVVSQNPYTIENIVERLDAVHAFATLPESASLAAANKRITNILKKAEAAPGAVNPALLQEAAEQALAKAMDDVRPQVDAAFSQGDYTGALKTLAALRAEVDSFFNDVMVNADDLALRNNRLALLSALHGMLNQVADISKLAA
ncbi:glycine--tRNA ligase subunit beta [Undibacterium sp. CY7W]|uniref:Glycine--tRNA ligase beta subunit n=1 Tax=Undibacterium rugosum TaxID=2762291 RepID=A0A923KZ90_9BURK|nr:glycine--tRNA ligase subunit beta [Undibacterium rugosum]MBC3934671.1 glycine--tRNA ligase subunit beta [Undibacterium rugosum]